MNDRLFRKKVVITVTLKNSKKISISRLGNLSYRKSSKTINRLYDEWADFLSLSNDNGKTLFTNKEYASLYGFNFNTYSHQSKKIIRDDFVFAVKTTEFEKVDMGEHSMKELYRGLPVEEFAQLLKDLEIDNIGGIM